jgi:hypothetical protein
MLDLLPIGLIDSEQCFMIDEAIDKKIITLRDYEKTYNEHCVRRSVLSLQRQTI